MLEVESKLLSIVYFLTYSVNFNFLCQYSQMASSTDRQWQSSLLFALLPEVARGLSLDCCLCGA